MNEVWTEISMVTFQKLTSWLGNSKVCSSSTFAPADGALMGFVARNHTRFKLGMTSPGCGILHLGAMLDAAGHSHHAIIQQKKLADFSHLCTSHANRYCLIGPLTNPTATCWHCAYGQEPNSDCEKKRKMLPNSRKNLQVAPPCHVG